ncbi:MAG: hypothetical protein A2224_03535 [Candidatus Magasanikbacteria bacterium RIFOXYA2_FULL_40_20]|nr:MAG: hypothetical protein A2224_03535 [Candidatus Magasanikbacteria bacterium RIFOXYA2_FULL_40_20]
MLAPFEPQFPRTTKSQKWVKKDTAMSNNDSITDTTETITTVLDKYEATLEPEAPELSVVHPTRDELLEIAKGMVAEKDGLTPEDLVEDENFVKKFIFPKWEKLEAEKAAKLAEEQKTEAEKTAAKKKALIANLAKRLEAEERIRELKKVKLAPKAPAVPKRMTIEALADQIRKTQGEGRLPPKLVFMDKMMCYLLFMVLVAKTKINPGVLSEEDNEVFDDWRDDLKGHLSSIASVLASVHGQTKESPRLQIPKYTEELQKMENGIKDLVNGEGELICYEFAKYARFLIPFGAGNIADKIRDAKELHLRVAETEKKFKAEAETVDVAKTEAEKAKAAKHKELVDAVSAKLGGGSEKLAEIIVAKMAAKVNGLGFTPEEAMIAFAMRKLRAGAKPEDEAVIRFATATGKSVDELLALLQKEREEQAIQAEIQKAEADKVKAKMPIDGRGTGRKEKPSGKKVKKANKNNQSKKGGNNK